MQAGPESQALPPSHIQLAPVKAALSFEALSKEGIVLLFEFELRKMPICKLKLVVNTMSCWPIPHPTLCMEP